MVCHASLSPEGTLLIIYPSKKHVKGKSLVRSQFASIYEFRHRKDLRDTWSLRVAGTARLSLDLVLHGQRNSLQSVLGCRASHMNRVQDCIKNMTC